MLDLLQVGDTEAQFSRGCDVSRLAEEQILSGIVKENVRIGCDAGGIVLPQGRSAVFAAFLFDRFQFNRVHRYRIGTNDQYPGLLDKVLDLRERPAMPNHSHAVHDVKNGFRAQRFDRAHHPDERICE